MINLKDFKQICADVRKFEKNNIKFDVAIDTKWDAQNKRSSSFRPTNFVLSTVRDIAVLHSNLDVSILPLPRSKEQIKIDAAHLTPCVSLAKDIVKDRNKYQLNNIRFVPTVIDKRLGSVINVMTITGAPPEQLIEDRTYRLVADGYRSFFCVTDENPIYQYLDRGFSFCMFEMHKKAKVLITNELTLDTWLCILLCYLDENNMQYLQNSVYLPAALAKVARVKMEKTLKQSNKPTYATLKKEIEDEFEKVNYDSAVLKFKSKELASLTFNEIKLTRTTAKYENVSIEATDLMDVLSSKVIFDDNLDIYVLIRGYIQAKFEELQATEITDENPNPSHSFVINGITIKIHRTADNTRRYVNDMPINIVEVETVVFRSSCFHSLDSYNKFVKEVSKMSLLWHDILANGLKVKINPNLDHRQLKQPEPPENAPRIFFKKIKNDIHIVLDDNTTTKINFSRFIQRTKTCNRLTSGTRHYITNANGLGQYETRNGNWCAVQIAAAIKECCTFPVKTVVGEGEAAVTTVTNVCGVTDEQANMVTRTATTFQDAAIAKSKIFLDAALKATGAVKQAWKGDNAYIVKGKIRTYAIKESNNKVYDFESGRHICIVEPGHTVGVGFDALAARLYALKHDERMVDKITTLRA